MINVSWGGWLVVRLWWFVVVDIVVLCVYVCTRVGGFGVGAILNKIVCVCVCGD